MRQVQTDLWETEVESPFPGLTTHAYLLIRDEGNVLFYNTGHLHEIDKMSELGGVAYQYLSHQDELGQSLKVIREKYGAKLGGHISEQAEFSAIVPPDILFDEREMHLGNIEVIPSPGHTPGSTCFLVYSPLGKHYLFTGDTLFHTQGKHWQAGYIKGFSDKSKLADSIRMLQTLEPDVVFSSAFSAPAGFQEMRPGQWAAHLDWALEQLLSK